MAATAPAADVAEGVAEQASECERRVMPECSEAGILDGRLRLSGGKPRRGFRQKSGRLGANEGISLSDLKFYTS